MYSCDMRVDVLNFDEAVSKFKDNIDAYGGFVESENFSDGGGASRWYIENGNAGKHIPQQSGSPAHSMTASAQQPQSLEICEARTLLFRM